MMRPVRPLQQGRGIWDAGGNRIRRAVDDDDISNANLSRHPRTLLLLWHEFLHGLDNNKPAKDFTRAERGRVKRTYSRRKVFWDLLCRMIDAGFTELIAIDRIYFSYGRNLSVTKILDRLISDKRRNGHPNLRF